MKDYLKAKFLSLKNSRKPWLRRTAGVLLVIGGIFGMLPVLGFWMLPLGLGLLSADSPLARRYYRKLTLWWGKGVRSLRALGHPDRGRGDSRAEGSGATSEHTQKGKTPTGSKNG